MLHRSITFIHICLLLLSAALSFFTVRAMEEVIVSDYSALLWVVEDDGSSDVGQVVEAVETLARDEGVTVAFETPDLHDPGSVRHLYLAVGDESSQTAHWIDEGYPSFGHTMHTEVHPFADLAETDPRGFYLVFGPEEDVYLLQDALAELGMGGSAQVDSQNLHWDDFLFKGDLRTTFVVALLCTVTVVGSGVLLGARSYGVLRLNGHSYARILARDLIQLARLWAMAAPLLAFGVLAFLYLYNGLTQLALFAGVAVSVLAIFAAVALTAHALTLALLHTTDILAALKGRIPARSATWAAYAVRVPALVFVLTIIAAVVASANNVRLQQKSFDDFSQAGEASRIMLKGSVDFDEMDTVMEPVVGQWLRQADTEGQVVLTAQEPSDYLMPRGVPRPDFETLVVNDTYLAHQEILSPDGERYGAEDSVRILLPESLSDFESDLREGTRQWLEFASGSDSDLEIEIQVLPTTDGQRVFTYGSDEPERLNNRPYLENPVIIALPNGAVLSDAQYFSSATDAAIVFPEPEAVEASIAQPPLSIYVNGVQMVATSAADHHQELVRTLRLESFNLAASTAVLFMTGIAVCLIHARTHAQTIFARHISGWSFAAIHRRLLAVEGLIALVFTGWATWDTTATLRRREDPTIPLLTVEDVPTTGVEPLLALGIAVTGLGLVIAVLAFFHHRIVREGASQA